MRSQLKKIIGLLMLFVLYGFNAYSQNPTYIMEIKNDVAVSPTEYTFDIYIKNTSTNATYIPTWELFGLQAGIKINKAILNGGVITPTIVAGFSDLLPSNQQTNANLFMAGFTNGIPNEYYGLKMTAKTASGVGTGTPITATEMRVCRIKLTNSVPFAPDSYANLTWSFVTTPWQTKVSFYKPAATDITVQSNHIIANRNNPALNASSGSSLPIVYNVTGGGSYCAGTIPTGVSVSLSGSQLAYSYQLYKDNVADGLPKAGTGAALSWNNLTAGIYTVKATDTAYTAMNGSATIIAPLTPIQQTITISASSNPSFQGDPVTFTATVTPTVAGQILNWYNNAVWQNTLGINTFSFVPANGDLVYCEAVPTGCYAGAQSNNIIMQVYPHHNITGGGTYCAGTTPTGISVSMSGSLTTLSYQLYKNNVAEGAPIVGNGSALSWNNLTAGTYTVKAINGSWTSNISGSAIVTSITSAPTPVVSVVNNCNGTSILTVTNALPGATFAWTGGLNGNPAIANAAGTYTVIQNFGSCTSLASAAVIVTPTTIPAQPIVTVNNTCNNSTFTITNGAVGATFNWSPAVAYINNVPAGTYTVTQTVGSCTSIASANVVAAPIAPTVQTVTIVASANPSVQGQIVTFTATATPTATGQIFDWYVNTVWQNTTGTNTFSKVPSIGDVVSCTAVPIGCHTGGISNSITMLPVIHTVSGGGTYCTGYSPTGISVNLSGSDILFSYQLYKDTVVEGAPIVGNGAALSWNNLTAGIYTVKAIYGNSIFNMSGSATVTVNALPATPVVTVMDNCGNSDLSTTATGTLLWSTGDSTSSINVLVGGTYTVTATENGCTSATGSGVAAPITLPVQPVVTVNNTCSNSAFTITNGEAGATFNWTPAVADLNNVPAGTYTVTQTVGACTSIASANVVAAPLAIPAQPVVTVNNTCGNSAFTITNGETGATFNWTPAVADLNNVPAGTYTVTQTVGTCTSIASANVVAAPVAIPAAPVVIVMDNCGNSDLSTTATGNLLWSNGASTSSINVFVGGTYTVTTTENGCTSAAGSGVAIPVAIPAAPIITVQNNCDNSVLTAGYWGGTLSWSNGASTPSITVLAQGTYTVTQTINGCASPAGTGVAAFVSPTTQAITITASANPSEAGSPVSFQAVTIPFAIGQTYIWYVNNIAQTSSNTYTFSYIPLTGDQIKCEAIVFNCFLGGVSNIINQIVNPTPNITNTWSGIINNNWNNAANWTNGIPLINHNVVIPSNVTNFPIIDVPAVCNNITITNGAQLINNSNLTIGNKVYTQQLLSASEWHFISSPINDATAYTFSNINPNNFGQNLYLQNFNEAWNGSGSPWINITDGFHVMSAGKGYEAWSDNNHIITMEGTQLNSANIVTPIMYTPAASYPGYNLIGNSYPSAINIQGFNTWGVNMDAAIYVWDGAQYLFQNTLFGTLGFTIAPKQGFMVKANAPGAMFTIPSTAKTFGGSFLKSTVADVLKLKVSGNGYNDAAFINFNSNATANYDGQFDVEKIFGIDAAPQFYSTITNKNLSINTLPSLTSPVVVPMSLNVGANATYTITASEMSSFANGTTITLEDTKTGTFTNLMQQAVYTFTASPADNANRFKVHFGVNGINENGNGNISIYSNNNVIYVNNSSNEVVKEIVVMNVLGQEILNKKAANTTVNTITMDVASAYYVVKVVTENKVYTEKVYVR